MPDPLIKIDERMYAVAEVAHLSGHQPEYILRLIEHGQLDAIRPAGPGRGRKGQWRIYPASLRRWLGVHERRCEKRDQRRAEAEHAAFMALMGGDDQ